MFIQKLLTSIILTRILINNFNFSAIKKNLIRNQAHAFTYVYYWWKVLYQKL